MPKLKSLKAAKTEAEGRESRVVRGKMKFAVGTDPPRAKVKSSRVRSQAIRKALAREKRLNSPRDLAEQAGRIARKRRVAERSCG